jgi:hypothetical protein
MPAVVIRLVCVGAVTSVMRSKRLLKPVVRLSFYCVSLVVFLHIYKLLIKYKVSFTLEQATKAQRGSRGIALLFL